MTGIKVLQADETFVLEKRGITLRTLLSHTTEFSYTLFNEKLGDINNLPDGTKSSGLEIEIK